MNKNVRIAKQLVKIAKMLCADDNYVHNFLKNFNYVDPNPEHFPTEIVSCKGNELVFDVVIVPSKNTSAQYSTNLASVRTTINLEGDENGMSGTVSTCWWVEYNYFRKVFTPSLKPEIQELNGTEENIRKTIEDNIQSFTKQIKLIHH